MRKPSVGAQPLHTGDLRRMLGQFATGVTVVTARTAEGYECLTASSFNSVSLEPPLVLFSIHRASRRLGAFEAAPVIGVNVLQASQRPLCRRFARGEPVDWSNESVRIGRHGCLLVEGALAHMECTRWAVYDGGDHRILVCRVEAFRYDEGGPPLVFFRGDFHSLAA